jgi:glycosyltransferase involved in cell wall biosynthesis
LNRSRALIVRWLDRIKRVYLSFRQIGTINTLSLYSRRIAGFLFLSRILRRLVVRYHGGSVAFQHLARVTVEPQKDTVSFVIPTWNGMKDNLPRLLESIRAQKWPDIQIVAVDSESSDETVSVLNQFGAKVIPIRKSEFRHDTSRNLGAENAEGKYLVFTVQDAWFNDSGWVEKGIRHLKAYGARSFFTPQICGTGADLYARFLSYNFVSANRYRPGVNIFGNEYAGNLAYQLGDPPLRQSLIHVDDTNHMVERAFFLKQLYSISTCEDMEFGRKIITSGEKFVFSTLSSIVHFHGYANHVNYFTRVFLDNLVINKLTSHKLLPVNHDGIVDALFFFSGLLFRSLEDIFNSFEKQGVENVIFDDSRRDTFFLVPEDEGTKVRYSRILDIFENRMMDLDDATLITCRVRVDGAFMSELLAKLDLTMSDLRPIFERSYFQVLRDRAFTHIRSGSQIANRRLGVHTVSIKEFRMYVTNLMIDVSASTIAWYCGFLNDETSVTMPPLKKMAWV